jgi:FtsZ-interacting cell division protein ZipA
VIVTTTQAEEFNIFEKRGLLAIIIGAAAIIIIGLLVCLIVYCCRRRSNSNEDRSQYSPGQNSVKIFSQKSEDESEKFMAKNSGNFYSNEPPRQVQSRYNEPDRQYIHNQINDDSSVQQAYTPTHQPTRSYTPTHATSYASPTNNYVDNSNHYSAINEPLQQRSNQQQQRNPSQRYQSAYPYHSNPPTQISPTHNYSPRQNHDYPSDQDHSYQSTHNASPYGSAHTASNNGPFNVDQQPSAVDHNSSPPRPVYFNELNSHIGKNKPKPMPRNPPTN